MENQNCLYISQIFKGSDFGLKIIDFGLARELGDDKEIEIGKLQGTVEFMAPEVMNCKTATFSADMWSAGVVTYMLLTGGKSPFYGGSRYKTMAKSLSCEYDLDIPELSHTSEEAKDVVRHLLLTDQTERLTASECLAHPWLSGADIYIDVLHELETSWMRSCLARRRLEYLPDAISYPIVLHLPSTKSTKKLDTNIQLVFSLQK